MAVLGASAKDVRHRQYLYPPHESLRLFGAIYPIHPTAADSRASGLSDLARTPELVDYAYVAIGAARIPGYIAGAAGRCRIAQVISSGFGEVEEGKSA